MQRLERLCIQLEGERPNFKSIIDGYCRRGFDSHKAYQDSYYAQIFSYIFLNQALKNAGAREINFSNKQTDHWYGQLLVYDNGWRQCGRLVYVGGKPTLFDIKISHWNKHEKKKRKSGVRGFLMPEVYEPKLRAVKELLKKNYLDYIVIIPEDIFFRSESPLIHDFVSNGRRLIPFYTNNLGYREDVVKAVSAAGLKLSCVSIPKERKEEEGF